MTIFASAVHHLAELNINFDNSKKFRVQEIEGIRFVWVRTIRYNHNNWRRILNILSFTTRSIQVANRYKYIIKNKPKPDVVIGSSVHLFAVLAAFYLAKKYNAIFIMEVRDLWPQSLVDMRALGNQNPITLILRALERFLYRRAARIITLLPHANDYIVANGGDAKKIIWIPNGVELSRFYSYGLTEKKNNDFIVLYMGSHGQANTLDVVIETAYLIQKKRFNDIHFILIGKGPEKNRLIKLSRKLNLKNIEFLDPIKKQQVPDFLSTANACIFNLGKIDVFKYGISSNKLFDYMAAAKPIIFSVNASNNPVEEAKCGISVPSCNPKDIAQAILHLYSLTEEERREMGLRGKSYVEKNHNWYILADRFEKMLIEMLA